MGPCTGLGHEEANPEAARPGLPVGILDILKCQLVLEFTSLKRLTWKAPGSETP